MDSYLSLLREFISFKSISTDPAFQPEINKTVEWLKKRFIESSFKVEVVKGFGNPIVLANFVTNSKLPTALVYGHYDVQPARKDDGWKGEPFEINKYKDRLYARGIIDNKGQVLVHIASIFDLIKNGQHKYNVKFIIEGDEETGSENIEKFFKENKSKLKCDFVIISDGELTDIHPCLDTSFRGIVNFTVKVTTSAKDNHSGLYGGSIPNAANELTLMLSKMHDKNGNLTIKGINNFKKFTKDVLKNNEGIPYSKKEFLEITGAKMRFSEKLDFYTQTGYLTSAEVTTLDSGYMGEGYKNAIPGTATAKVNFRLAPGLKVKAAIQIFKQFVKDNTPAHVISEICADQYSDGFFVDTKSEVAKRAKDLLVNVYKTEVYNRPCGAIIPIVGLFIKYLKVPVVSVGLANEDCNMHGANENFSKVALGKALLFSKKFFSEV